MTYVSELEAIIENIPNDIINLSIPRKRSSPPTQAFSDFTIHKEQGDWAEKVLTVGLNDVFKNEYKTCKYGRSDSLIAGQEGFKEFYEKYQDELDSIGKKPDVLILKNDSDEDDVKSAILGIEIRSSSFLAKKYRENNEDNPLKFLSFTPKMEDILVVMKWIKKYGVPHYYAQVFFDEIYIISFRKILEVIHDHSKNKQVYKINKNTRNQLKTTIHINISCGKRIGVVKTPPVPHGARTELDSGRLLHYVKFHNGVVNVDKPVFYSIIRDSLQSR